MTNITEDLAALLAEHGDYILLHPENGEAGYYCDCGQRLTDAFDDLDFPAHQAEVIAAAGWVKGREVASEVMLAIEEDDEWEAQEIWFVDIEDARRFIARNQVKGRISTRNRVVAFTDWQQVA